MAKVYALRETVRRHIFHPLTKGRFDGAGVATWPLDRFTRNRLRDGDISLSPPEAEEEGEDGSF
jgi:hypothetical protein